ncbi:hypothetical protein AV530_005768 [Patagioenas fasciata monilis]|uniref:Uncharacterized protein n=1 Tax=Patagioenas fasciata monilis TaxID=372326 RepID=A0A1V4JMJ4_PATFA|nr:hypothetical protein AV530_005768 [Patagioenas fasciata monilis]
MPLIYGAKLRTKEDSEEGLPALSFGARCFSSCHQFFCYFCVNGLKAECSDDLSAVGLGSQASPCESILCSLSGRVTLCETNKDRAASPSTTLWRLAPATAQRYSSSVQALLMLLGDTVKQKLKICS